MNLKEAFRYQNKLDKLLENSMHILAIESNIMTIENTHLRSRAVPTEEDEVVIEEPASPEGDRINDVITFVSYLLAEKEKLSKAIHKAKADNDYDIDTAAGLNAVRRNIATSFNTLVNKRSSEKMMYAHGTGYNLNNEGEQVTYKYNIKQVSTIKYDRNIVRKALSEITGTAEETSARLDITLITTQVDYTPPFDVNDNYTDILDKYCGLVS